MQVWNRSCDHKGPLPGDRASVVGCLFLLPLFFTNPALAATPILTDFSLTHSYTCGPRYFRLHGADIESGVTIKLVQAGQPDILATDVINYIAAGQADFVTGRFDLSDGTAGSLWSVEVINPGGEIAIMADILEVVPDCPRGSAGDLYVCNSKLNNIVQFDGLTGDFVCIFAGAQQYGEATELTRPGRLTWAPNGNLLVTTGTPGCSGSVVNECDGSTGEFLGYVVPPPCDQNRNQEAMTFGGPNGDLYIQATADWDDVIAQEYDPAPPWTFIQDGLRTAPPMESPDGAAFASNGNLLVVGRSQLTPVPTFREYEYNTGNGEFELVREVVDLGQKSAVVESPDGCCYVIPENKLGGIGHRVDRYSIETFQFLDMLVPPSPCLSTPKDPCFFEAMRYPFDLAYGPDGRLFVSGRETTVPDPTPGPGYAFMGAIHVFDPATGQQLDVFGQRDDGDTSIPPDPEKLWKPYGLAFKPMPGDYSSAGGAFAGDWTVNLADVEKFVPAFWGPGIRPSDPHALLSFDFDRDSDIDLADYAKLQCVFGATVDD